MAQTLNTISRELQRLAIFWSDALRLGDWKITLRTALEGELDGELAHVEMVTHMKTAVVVLRRGDEVDQDLEEDLVHELLHLVFFQMSAYLFEREDMEQIPFEFGLNAVSAVLVDLRRKGLAKRARRLCESARRTRA